jgi:choice-of-anchor C domain-containing protein
MQFKSKVSVITARLGIGNSMLCGFLCSFLCCLGFESPASAANLIVNGSFEEGDFKSNIVGLNFARLNPGSSALTAWTVDGRGIDWHNTNEMKLPSDGNYLVDLNLDGTSSGSLSQTFSTTPGQFYNLDFYLAGPEIANNSAFPNPRQVRVEIGGVNQIFSTPSSNHLALKWQLHQLNFQATVNQTTLKFSSLNNSGFWGPALDNVSVVKSSQSIPESSSHLSIIIFGSFGMALALKGKLS